MTVAIGNDHAGTSYKFEIVKLLNNQGIEVINFGTDEEASMENIRAALCWNDELVALACLHNDANILSIPARFVSQDDALQFVNTFLNTDFEGGRHKRRIDKIPASNC